MMLFCSLFDAVTEFSDVVIITSSSANVAVNVFLSSGRSAVNSV